MPTCDVKLYCPPMRIYAVDGGHKRTAAEPMVATITFSDGSTVRIANVVIPPTAVDKQRLWRWVVEACIGHGRSAEAEIVTHLPPELTTLNLLSLTMTAQPIDAPTTLTVGDERWSGPVHWGACTVRGILGPVQTADAITATGTLTRE